MWGKGVWALGLLACNGLMAGGLDLCLENPARVDDLTVQSFRTELHRIVEASGRSAAFVPCGPGAVRIVLRRDPPDQETSALAAIRQRDGRLLPEIEVFVGPTSQLIGVRLCGVLGRALARVTSHELGHYLNRSARHAAHGAMMERLSAAHLMAADRAFFLLPPAE